MKRVKSISKRRACYRQKMVLHNKSQRPSRQTSGRVFSRGEFFVIYVDKYLVGDSEGSDDARVEYFCVGRNDIRIIFTEGHRFFLGAEECHCERKSHGHIFVSNVQTKIGIVA